MFVGTLTGLMVILATAIGAGLDPNTSIGAAGALLAASIAAFVSWRNGRKITEVHYLVNQRLDLALDRIEELSAALAAENVAVPPDVHHGGRTRPLAEAADSRPRIVAAPIDHNPNGEE